MNNWDPKFGKSNDELNLVIHIPKTEARSNAEEINFVYLKVQDWSFRNWFLNPVSKIFIAKFSAYL